MTVPLTSELLQAAYDMLRATPPFNTWNMPEGEDVIFKISKDAGLRGDYRCDARRRHNIRVSAASIGHLNSLVEVMAHEMIHLHEEATGMVRKSQHSAAFRKMALQVCKIHGFDPKLF